MKKSLVVLSILNAAGCGGESSMTSSDYDRGGSAVNPVSATGYVPPMDPKRNVSEQDCSRQVDITGGNLMCREVTAAERRARIEEEERQARARMEAEARAARERLERERAAQLAREEAARKARAAEEERLAAERRRLEEEAARKAREARERQEREQAEALARQRAEQEAREAAERERQRLEQEWLAGRAHLESFVATYGKVGRFKEVAGQITRFLDKTR